MALAVVLLVISLGLSGLVGFAAHRASICTVKAVAEILTTRRAFMLVSFAKTALWVMLVTLALNWLVPTARSSGWELSIRSLAGGLLFGVGAAINGGCAFSTLTRLAGGRLSMLLSLAGFCLGVAGHVLLTSNHLVRAPTAAATYLEPPAPWTVALLAALLLWAVWEGPRLWRTRPTGTPLRTLAFADRYRLSTAAFLMGISNAILYASYGTWAYTSILNRGVREVLGSIETVQAIYWYLFAALLAGMFLSAWCKGGFRLDWRPSQKWRLYFLGGLLMGLGAAMVPGGNDVLILNSIPGLSPHAFPAYLAMIVGIVLALIIMKRINGQVPAVDCRGDLCTRD